MSHFFQTKTSVRATHARMAVSAWTACLNTSACARMSSPAKVARCVSRVTLRWYHNAVKFPPNPHIRHPIDRPWVETWCVFFSQQFLIYVLPDSSQCCMKYVTLDHVHNDTRLLTEELQSDMNARPTQVRTERVCSHITPVAVVSCLLYFEYNILLLVYEYINKLAAV